MLSLLSLNSEERGALQNAVALASSLGGGAVASKLKLTDLLPALQGEAPAPNWLSKTAQAVNKFGGNPALQSTFMNALKGFVTTNNIDYPNLVSGMRKLASMVGVSELSDDDDQAVLQILLTVSSQVYSEEESPSYTGMVKCPKCKYLHLV